MKIALVHELLTMRGGAERVLRIIADMFPEAPIYTLLYDESKLGDWFPRERVRTSRIHQSLKFQLLPRAQRFNHHWYLAQFPSAVEAWDFSEFDLVISTSSACAHGIITNGKPKHLCYVHSPARYLWDRTHDVLERAGHGPLGTFRRAHLEKIFHHLRIWDTESAERPDALLAASKEVERRIELYWRRESTVLTPPVDDVWFTPRETIKHQMEHPDYYLVVSTLVPYKRIELAIQACNARGAYLKIVGEGPDAQRLKKMAGPTVEFYGYRERDELADLYANAKAVLFPGEEDFGLVPLESLACGTPVIAYAKGGALETLEEGVTGTFFAEQSAEALDSAMERLSRMTVEPSALRSHAKKFSKNNFEEGLRRNIDHLLRK